MMRAGEVLSLRNAERNAARPRYDACHLYSITAVRPLSLSVIGLMLAVL
jgi:hypothetical protein